MPFDSITSSELQLVGAAGGTYRLESMLGYGALGMVYLAHQEHLGRKVAIKFLREPYAREPRFAAALQREARAGCRIEHPNVARTYDVGTDEQGRGFLVMELLRGAPVETVLRNVPRPPIEWSVSIMAQVLAGLQAAHDRGVIHRDVKPGNVMIETTLDDDEQPIDVAKLCDFGISDIVDDAADADDQADGGFDSSACGTPNYMSPEQALHQPCTAQSDLYSCGVMLFELATGRLPFDAATPQVTACQHVHQAPPRPRDIRPDVPAALERIILRALAKHPEHRYASAREMRAELLALRCARRSTSLLDNWADAPTDRAPTQPPVPARRQTRKPFTRRSNGLRSAVLGACAMTIGAALACHELPRLQSWLDVSGGASAQVADAQR